MLSTVDHDSALARSGESSLSCDSLCTDARFRDGILSDPGIQHSAQSMQHQHHVEMLGMPV